MSVALDTPFKTEKSIRSVNFFNNRLLSAEDLNAEKAANRAEHKQLGRAFGEGIVRGLEVSVQDAAQPSLAITAGLAVSRTGRTVELSDDVVVVLPTQRPTNNTIDATLDEFKECEPPQAGVYLLNEGVYLLTIRPAEIPEGRAQVSGLNGAAAGCNIKYRVSAVKFRLISLDDQLNQELSDLQVALNAATATTLAGVRNQQNHLLRNRVAYRCFGMGDTRLDSFISDPFGATATDYGLLADLRQLSDANPNKLTNCEVPLALVYWTNGGLRWLDMWSVRRRISAADPSGLVWPLLADRRAMEGEAMFWQFQDQIKDMRGLGLSSAQIVARDWFAFLPPVSQLPFGDSRSSRSFDYRTFFGHQTYRDPVYIEGSQVRPLLREAYDYPPIDLRSEVFIWLYLVRENIQAIDTAAINRPQAYLTFASGRMRFRGAPHFDVNRWNYSNYA